MRFQIVTVLQILGARVDVEHACLDGSPGSHPELAWTHARDSLVLHLAVVGLLRGGCHLRVTDLNRLELLSLPRQVLMHFGSAID